MVWFIVIAFLLVIPMFLYSYVYETEETPVKTPRYERERIGKPNEYRPKKSLYRRGHGEH